MGLTPLSPQPVAVTIADNIFGTAGAAVAPAIRLGGMIAVRLGRAIRKSPAFRRRNLKADRFTVRNQFPGFGINLVPASQGGA